MEIKIIASSSSGNCYLVRDAGSAVLLECGIRIADIRKALGFGVTSLAGCLITHEHADHSKAIRDVMRAGIDVYASAGTFEALGVSGHRLRPVKALERLKIGPWTVLPFDTVHDAKEPLGFFLVCGDRKLLYLTDTAYCNYRFAGLTHLLIECNHSRELLRQNVASGDLPLALKNRVMRNHMSLEQVLKFLAANDLSRVQEIHLLHLSDSNSDAQAFKVAVAAATGKPVYVAPS